MLQKPATHTPSSQIPLVLPPSHFSFSFLHPRQTLHTTTKRQTANSGLTSRRYEGSALDSIRLRRQGSRSLEKTLEALTCFTSLFSRTTHVHTFNTTPTTASLLQRVVLEGAQKSHTDTRRERPVGSSTVSQIPHCLDLAEGENKRARLETGLLHTREQGCLFSSER